MDIKDFTYKYYFDQVQKLAEETKAQMLLIENEEDEDSNIDSIIENFLEYSHYIAYNMFHTFILFYSNNDTYGVDNDLVCFDYPKAYCKHSEIIKSMAYWAFFADVKEWYKKQ